jgi:succinate dehydrogenase/fumarate reductase cytochrome b subunit
MDTSQPMSYTSTPRTGETAWLWIFKILTGPLLVILLGVHLIVNHLVAETGLLTWSDVVLYFDNPWIVLMEITFLATVVTHSLLGIRGIILDMNPKRKLLKTLDWVLFIFGTCVTLYGLWLALTISSLSV